MFESTARSSEGNTLLTALRPSHPFPKPSTKQAGNLRTKYGKDITITFKPQNTNFSCCFFVCFPSVLQTTHEPKPPLPRQCLRKHLSWEKTLFAHHNQAETFQSLLLFIPQTLPSLPPTLCKMTRQGQFWSTSSDFPRSSVKHLKSTRKNKC